MSESEVPRTVQEFCHHKVANLHPNAQLVFVFDPGGRLALADRLVAGGRTWQVCRYDGNDLALRAALAGRDGASPPLLLWVTGRATAPPTAANPLEISSLIDLLARADGWFDLSLAGVLHELIPGETWPVASLTRFAGHFAANLPALVQAHAELRARLDPHAALDGNALRTLALHVSQPGLPVQELIFHRDTPAQALQRYVKLAWAAPWDEQGRALLQEQARNAPALDETAALWFATPLADLARYLYFRRFLGRIRLSQIASHLRGLGLVSFDPTPLEAWVDEVLTRWEREASWRTQVMVAAEAELSASELEQCARLVAERGADDPWPAIEQVEAPGIGYALLSQLLAGRTDQALDRCVLDWRTRRPAGLNNLPQTRWANASRALRDFLDETAQVLARLAAGVQPEPALAGILDWYVQGGFYDLEFACARAADHARSVPELSLARHLQEYLDGLRTRIRDFLQQADEALARQIAAGWKKYLASPRLATNVIHQLVGRRRFQPTPERRLWVIIFDGMRWDSWQAVVKPRLLEQFELVGDEKAYLSLLPSWTTIARTSLLAGQPPQHWPRINGRYTRDQKALAAARFNILADVEQRLQFFSGMEADRTYRQLHPDARFPWNILVFNISDDNLHQERGSLTSFNAKIGALLDSIMQTLEQTIGPEDTVVLSSDHGFMELDNQDGIVVDAERTGDDHPVRYRYLVGMEHPAGFTLEHPGFRPPQFTVAVGRRWFQRAEDRRPPDRYAHGGLSLAEMAVPGVMLRRIVEKRWELALQKLPQRYFSKEGESLLVELMVSNSGNQPAEFLLQVQLAGDGRLQEASGMLAPAAQQMVSLSFKPKYRSAQPSQGYVTVLFGYRGHTADWVRRRYEVPLEIEPRTDVIEIQFGGLDELDDLM